MECRKSLMVMSIIFNSILKLLIIFFLFELDINQLASDQEFPLSLAILVKDKDKKKDVLNKQLNAQQLADRKKLNLIDRKNKPKGKFLKSD